MPERRNPRGWQELEALPRRSPLRDVVVDLRDPDSMLMLKAGRALLVRVLPAPDGTYELQRSGKLVVQAGQVRDVLGLPDATATAAPAP